MTLSFLYPLFWFAGLAVAAPIWLHLRRRAETNVLRFSAVKFLDDQPQARRSPLHVQNWLLLLLRVIALLLLVAAFAWPYLPGEVRAPVRESRIYILDNTLSHQAGEQFTAARDRLASELRSLGPDVQAAVIELTALPRVVVEFKQRGADAADALEQLAPSSQRGSYLEAFRMAQSLLASALGDERSIVFVGDNQANQWLDGQNIAPFLHKVDVRLPAARKEPRLNVGVFDARVRRVFLGDKSRIEGEVKVSFTGGMKAVELDIVANGESKSKNKLEPPKDEEVLVVSFDWDDEPTEWVKGEVRAKLEGDELPGDDSVVFSLPPVREGKVVLAARSQFLRTALSPEVMQGRWAATLATDETLASGVADIRGGEVLCMESRYLQSAESRALLQHYLDKGRGVVLLVDHVSPASQGVLREHGIELKSVVDMPAGNATFRYVYGEHPIFAPFRSPDFGNLLEVQIRRYRRLTAASAVPLAFSQHGDLLVFQVDRPHGKFLVLSFGLERADTNWPVHPTFVPWLDLVLQSVRPDTTLPSRFEPGERGVWSLPDLPADAELVIGSGEREEARVPVKDGRVEFRAPSAPGLYEVSLNGGRTVEQMLEVNPSPQESRLTYADPAEIVAAWTLSSSGGDEGPTLADLASQMELSRTEIFRQRIWWWLLIAALAALVAEMLGVARRVGAAGAN